MARSDLDPILQENDENDDDDEEEERTSTTTTTPSSDWSWICFHCHSSRSRSNVITPSVVCICRTLKSALYRRAFYYSTRLGGGGGRGEERSEGVGGVGGGGTCNLEYQKQVVDRPTYRRRFSQIPTCDPWDDIIISGSTAPVQDRGCFHHHQTPLLPRRFTYCECTHSGDSIIASPTYPAADSSFSSLGNMTPSSDVGDVQLQGQQQHTTTTGGTCVECDNKSCIGRRNGCHRPVCINWLANIGSHSCAAGGGGGFCSSRLQNQKPNSVTRMMPEVQRKHQQQYQQQQQQVCQRVQDKDDDNNRTTTTSSTYTRCKLQHRSYDDLRTLLENFRMQVQAVSEDLVRLLEERHDLRQQIDMRNIAIEQLLRLQDDDDDDDGEQTPTPTTATRRNQVDATGTINGETIEGRGGGGGRGGGEVEERTNTGRDEEQQGIVRRTSETKECFFTTTTTTLRTIRTIE